MCVYITLFPLNIIFFYVLTETTQKSCVLSACVSGWSGLGWGQVRGRCLTAAAFTVLEKRGRRSDYPHQDMKRENSALVSLCPSNIHRLFPLVLLLHCPQGLNGSHARGQKGQQVGIVLSQTLCLHRSYPEAISGKQLLRCFRKTRILKLFIWTPCLS